MWGDYHVRELGLILRQLADQQPGYFFFGC
jgi:hypothetical protein